MLHSAFPALQPAPAGEPDLRHHEELFDLYPGLAPEEREQAFVKKHRAVFVKHIGWPLGDGRPHGVRAPDYDDWSLNGDLLYYHPELDCCLEVSSMGIRVDASSMFPPAQRRRRARRLDLPFHRAVIGGKAAPHHRRRHRPRAVCACCFCARAHVGEVQVSVWPAGVEEAMAAGGIRLL